MLFLLTDSEPYHARKLIEKMALRRGMDIREVFAELVIDAQDYFRNQTEVTSSA
ncbi:hypothetical protein V1502_17000 [Bacillus sp. SCS-153A]|uniref:hypothetical protein n=1 Tax=Rossellomorea sedimentorum TaxID=3115294 RepID=UPI0039066BF4